MEIDYCVWIIKIASNLIVNLQLTIYSWLSLWDQMMNQWKKNREKNLWWFILTIAMFEGGGQRSFIFLKIFFSSRVAVSPSSISSPFTNCMLGKPIIIIFNRQNRNLIENNMFCFLSMSLFLWFTFFQDLIFCWQLYQWDIFLFFWSNEIH